MSDIKIELRDSIDRMKNAFKRTGNEKYMIDAAIMRGIYFGLGGTKLIPVHPNYSIIANVVEEVIKAKVRMKDEGIKDIKRLMRILTKNVIGISGIDLNISSEKPIMTIYFTDKNKFINIGIKTYMTTSNLVNITVGIIKGLLECGGEGRGVIGDEELRYIGKVEALYINIINDSINIDRSKNKYKGHGSKRAITA